MFLRDKTRVVKIGKISIGGGNPIRVQSMTKTLTSDVRATVAQIKRLEKVGCEIIRVAVPDIESARKVARIKKNISIPLVADIHYDYKLALEAIKQGADKIRINPGNMSKEKVREVVKAAKDAGIPIRIGVNTGSLKSAHSDDTTDKRSVVIVETAIDYIKMMEDMDFTSIVVSLKASDVTTTIESYQLFAERSNYPLHIGITEAGPSLTGVIKSSVGVGVLLYAGLGDTIRVSLTSTPEEEVRVGYKILQSLGLRTYGVDIISCPTCARCKVNLIKIVDEFEKRLLTFNFPHLISPLRVAIMGCVVNGPGEAKDADIGIAAGKDTGLLFKNGKPIRKLLPSEWVDSLIKEIKRHRSIKKA